MKWRWQLTTVRAKARRPWSLFELVRVNRFSQLGVSMGLSKPYQAQVGSPAHLVPVTYLKSYLPSSYCLPVVCPRRLKSHCSAGEPPAGLSGICYPAPLTQGPDAIIPWQSDRAGDQTTLPVSWVFFASPYQTPGRKDSVENGDLAHTPHLADLNPLLRRTAAQTRNPGQQGAADPER